MLTGEPLVPKEMAANDGTLGWLLAMSGHKDTPDTALNTKFDENSTYHTFIPTLTLSMLWI
jgi:hypothetical protein